MHDEMLNDIHEMAVKKAKDEAKHKK